MAGFHLTFLVKVPAVFHFTAISTSGTPEPQGTVGNSEVDISAHVSKDIIIALCISAE